MIVKSASGGTILDVSPIIGGRYGESFSVVGATIDLGGIRFASASTSTGSRVVAFGQNSVQPVTFQFNPGSTVDFSNAAVTGLLGVGAFTQVYQLTSDHTEFYLYVVFGGVGFYTPVYASVLGRTYTCALSISAGNSHPIYGLTITVSASGSVSVSNIYAVYPANEGKDTIKFNLDSFTIYAR